MVNKFTAMIVSILTFFSSLSYSVIKTCDITDNSGFQPVIRFAVMSDTHIDSVAGKRARKMLTAIKIANEIADKSTSYDKLDAILFVGDLTDHGNKGQFWSFKALTDASIKEQTDFLPIMAKGHDGSASGKKSLSYFEALTGFESDFHKIINGIHFIGISASKTGDTEYSEDQRTWLDRELSNAVRDGADKPVFVFHHEHVKDTVYGSRSVDGWGTDYFKDILSKYPQVVHFSGHSHYPLNDPRSIWQGEFTAIGTGEIYYLEFTVDEQNQIHPEGNRDEAEVWIVEVNKDNVIRLRGIDVVEQKILCEYYLNGALSRDYTPDKQQSRSSAPLFENDSVKLTKSISSLTLKFNAATETDRMPIVLYRAYIYDKDGNEICSSYTIPDYYSATTSENIKIKIDKPSRGNYSVRIVAENAYGMQSEPIITELIIK